MREREVEGLEATIGRAATTTSCWPTCRSIRTTPRCASRAPAGSALESSQRPDRSSVGRQVRVSARRPRTPRSHPDRRFGDYASAFEPGERRGGRVTVTRRGRRASRQPAASSRCRPRCSADATWPGCWAAGILLLCLMVPMIFVLFLANAKIHPDQQWSTGPLSKVARLHAEATASPATPTPSWPCATNACLTCHTADPASSSASALANAKRLGSPFEPRLAAEHAAARRAGEGRAPARRPRRQGQRDGPARLNHPTDRCASCHLEHTPAKGGGPGRRRSATSPSWWSSRTARAATAS